MKIKTVECNNRKKCFEIHTPKGKFEFPYSRLHNKPTQKNPVENAYSDPELGHEGFTYLLKSGKEDSVLMDQILEYGQDPDYLRETLLYKLTIAAQKIIEQKSMPKREIIRRMKTSPTQFYRLLDQTNTKKSIDEMIRLLAALDQPVDIVFRTAA